MKQIILPVTVHLNIRLPLALLQCGGCGKCQHEEKQA